MQFHHHGYVDGDPRRRSAEGVGLDRSSRLPSLVDVLVIGAGPAGMIAAAQLSQFPEINTRIVDRRPERLQIGRADGVQCRTVETFQAFGFADQIANEAYQITETAFWKPSDADPAQIVRAGTTPDDPEGLSEFPHIVVNQARVLDYFAETMANSPTRMAPDYGLEFVALERQEHPTHPVEVTLVGVAGPNEGELFKVRAKYVVGADGARSPVRAAIGARFEGDQANHAWGVMDVLAVTDFPDVRKKTSIQSAEGNILLIPREGGYLFRLYVDLGEVADSQSESVKQTPLSKIIEAAQQILRPYSLDIREVVWHSVYEVGHRLADRFDDSESSGPSPAAPRVFIVGDACHTHSAKAGQGMNVSMQDGFNLAWKLGHVLQGRSDESLLATYAAERRVVAQELLEFDREWSGLIAAKPEALADPSALQDFYVRTAEFPAGFMTEYAPSKIVGEPLYQHLAEGFPIGKRFRSAKVVRLCDGNPIHLGHEARADGRWRLYVFADAGEATGATELGRWLLESGDSPLRVTPAGGDEDAWFDAKIIYQSGTHEDVPLVFRPRKGPYGLVDREKSFVSVSPHDIFSARRVDRSGAVVIVRPDQYVAHVLPLDRPDELAAFFRSVHGG